MESILIACALVAVALLLLGYRRLVKRNAGEGDWLFAYRVDEGGKQGSSTTARK
jgi:hypothetical protein